MFENGGRGIGRKGKDNGALIVVAVDDRRVRVEVGYDLEEFVTDGFAGDTIRQVIAPEFRSGNYGRGLLAGTTRIINRVAERRGVTLAGRTSAAATRASAQHTLPTVALRSAPVAARHRALQARPAAATRALGWRTVERLEQRRRSLRRRYVRRWIRGIRRRRRRWRWRRLRRIWRWPQRRWRRVRRMVGRKEEGRRTKGAAARAKRCAGESRRAQAHEGRKR